MAALLLLAASTPGATQSSTSTEPIPDAVETALRTMYAGSAGEIRYFAAAMNLDGEGHFEIIVHVVGQAVCGSGGCDTLVFTPEGNGFRLVAKIGSTRLPVRASPRRSSGWRNLIVAVSGDSAGPHDAELRFDGTSYPSSPAAAAPHRDAKTISQVVIPLYVSSDPGRLLNPEPRSFKGHEDHDGGKL